MNELLCEILSTCHYISRNTDADVFFEYAPHCNAYSIFWYRVGWTEETAINMEFLECVTKITCENMRKTIAKLNALAEEMGVL